MTLKRGSTVFEFQKSVTFFYSKDNALHNKFTAWVLSSMNYWVELIIEQTVSYALPLTSSFMIIKFQYSLCPKKSSNPYLHRPSNYSKIYVLSIMLRLFIIPFGIVFNLAHLHPPWTARPPFALFLSIVVPSNKTACKTMTNWAQSEDIFLWCSCLRTETQTKKKIAWNVEINKSRATSWAWNPRPESLE